MSVLTVMNDYLEESDVAGSNATFPLQSLHHDGRQTVTIARRLDALHL